MCKVYGYCRVSTKDQSIERQERNILAAYPTAQIVREAFTGTKIVGRKGFLRVLSSVRAGDTIVFDSVSRMSRSAEEGFTLYESLFNQGVNLVFLKEPQINTDTYKAAIDTQISVIQTGNAAADELTGAVMEAVKKYMMRLAAEQVRLSFIQAQKEVDDLHQRTREGIREVKRRNEMIDAGIVDGEKKQIGQAAGAKLTVKKAAPAKDKIRKNSKAFGGALNDTDCIKIAGVSRPTFYKYKAEIAAEMAAEAEQIDKEISAAL